jgi:hypothetical protein
MLKNGAVMIWVVLPAPRCRLAVQSICLGADCFKAACKISVCSCTAHPCPDTDIELMWHEQMGSDFKAAGVSKADTGKVLALLNNNGALQLSITQFMELLKKYAADMYNKTRIVSIVTETMALYN